MPILLKLLQLLSSIFKPVLEWWKSLSWHDRIIVIAIVLVAGTIFVQYKIIQYNQTKIELLNAKVSELATKSEVAAIDGKITATKEQIVQYDESLAKLQADLVKQRPGVKSPTITGMKSNEIVEEFKKLGN
jgi:outer membrane murein-binding lipoprotein Lpp